MSKRNKRPAVIFGAMFDEKDILETIHPSKRASSMLSTSEDLDARELMQNFVDNHKTFMFYHVFAHEPHYDLYFVGRDWDTIKANETGKHFRENVAENLNRLFDRKVVCRTIVVPTEEMYETSE
jgi:hypothetical protein